MICDLAVNKLWSPSQISIPAAFQRDRRDAIGLGLRLVYRWYSLTTSVVRWDSYDVIAWIAAKSCESLREGHNVA